MVFKDAIANDTVDSIVRLKSNKDFLREIISSLRQTFMGSVIEDRRRSEFEVEIEFGNSGNHYSRRGNLYFTLTDQGIKFSTCIWYRGLRVFGLEEAYSNGKYSVVGALPPWLTLCLIPSSGSGNHYGFDFSLSRDDLDLSDKLKLITKICKVNDIHLNIDHVA